MPVLLNRPFLFTCLTISALISLSGCANTKFGQSLEQSLAADPRLKEEANITKSIDNSPPVANTPITPPAPQLPADFPGEIPRYSNAQLVETRQESSENGVTRWTTTDPVNIVQSFYQKQFKDNKWEIVNQNSADQPINLVARQDNLQVTVSIKPYSTGQNSPIATEFTIEYDRSKIANQPSPTPTTKPTVTATPTPTPTPTPSEKETASPKPVETQKISADFRKYIEDLTKLGLFAEASGNTTKSNSDRPSNIILTEANKPITRREFARWLFTANNLIYANRSGYQIRPGVANSEVAFQDITAKDTDFEAIQGLAEAGIIPSPLSGDNTAVTFRPDAILTREELLVWKVPLDLRKTLPNAAVEAVQQTWGFQDVNKINPKALRSILADFSNGDLSNIRRAFGFTSLFQPKRSVTRSQAAAAIWYFGTQGDGLSAQDALQTKNQPQQQSSPPPTN